MSRYQNVSQRARKLRAGSTATRHAEGSPGSGVYPIRTAAARPTRSTPTRVTKKGSATARSESASVARAQVGRPSVAVLSRIDMQSVVRIARPSPTAVVVGAVLGTRLPILLVG